MDFYANAPRLLLHCCCAPCASYVLEVLSPLYDITVFFYNPNIMPRGEFELRAGEFDKLLSGVSYPNPVNYLLADYRSEEFVSVAREYTGEPEGGLRCRACFELRLGETAARAASGGYDLFATTLTVSPHKPAAVVNEIGARLGAEHGVEYLVSDFKKRDGYKRSVELSKRLGLYRQSYCGCRLIVDS